MCVFLISPVPITEPLTSELIDTPVFYNLAPRPIKYRVSVPIPRQDPSQGYSHKELAKITGSLSHTLIATLILSDKHAAQCQQELTNPQRRIEQLEREAQERQEGTDEVGQGAEEEINRLKETLAATSHEMEQIKEDFADRADKLQYAEELLNKAKTDFRDKNSRIKALESG